MNLQNILIISIILSGLLFGIYIIILYTYSENYENAENDNKKLDIVITWVDSDKEFEKDKDYWINKESYKYILSRDNYKRYNDNQELKYLLRSVEKYFPHFNNIYLVVRDGQFPTYLKHNNHNLKIINTWKV